MRKSLAHLPKHKRDELKLVYPDLKDPEDERARKRVDISRVRAEYFFAHGQGNRQRGVRGTLWSAYNGVTELVDHAKTAQADDRRLDSMWFGSGYTTKARAFIVAPQKAKTWLN